MFLLMLTNILSWIGIWRLLDDDVNELWNGIKYLKIIKNFEPIMIWEHTFVIDNFIMNLLFLHNLC